MIIDVLVRPDFHHPNKNPRVPKIRIAKTSAIMMRNPENFLLDILFPAFSLNANSNNASKAIDSGIPININMAHPTTEFGQWG
jgi:hypothetical protein